MQNLQNSKVISNSSSTGNESLDRNLARKLKKKMASEFRKQLTSEVPTTQDEERLRRLIAQVKANKLIVKLNSKTNLHAKLYLIHRLGIKPPTNGRFGFSVQKKIWQEVNRDDDVFFERLGWQIKGSALIIEEPEKLIRKLTGEGVPISAKKLRKGHLPLRVHCFGNPTGVGSYEMVYEYLFSRLETCQIR